MQIDVPQNTGTIVHIGAGQGSELPTYLSSAAERIILVEPNPQLAEQLRQQAEGDNRVTVLEQAVGGARAGSELHVYNLAHTASLYPLDGLKNLYPGLRLANTHSVQRQTPAQLFNQLSIQGYHNLLVVQAPGAESDILTALAQSNRFETFANIYFQATKPGLYQCPKVNAAEKLKTLGYQLTEGIATSTAQNLYAQLDTGMLALTRLTEQLDEAKQKHKKERSAHKKVQKQLTEYKTNAKATNARLAELDKTLTETQVALQNATQAEVGLQQQLSSKQEQLQQQQDDLQATQQQLAEQTSAAQAHKQALASLQADYEQQLGQASQNAQSDLKAAQQQLQKSTEQAVQAEQQNQQLIQQQQKSQQQLQQHQKQIGELKQQLEQANSQNKVLQEKLQPLQQKTQQTEQLEKQLAEQKKSAQAASEKLEQQKKQAEQLQQTVNEKQAAAEDLQKRFENQKNRADQAEKQLAEHKEQLQVKSQNLEKASTTLKQTQNDLADKKQTLAELQQKLEGAQKRANNQQARADSAEQKLNEQQEQAAQNLKAEQDAHAQTKQDLARAQEQAAQLTERLNSQEGQQGSVAELQKRMEYLFGQQRLQLEQAANALGHHVTDTVTTTAQELEAGIQLQQQLGGDSRALEFNGERLSSAFAVALTNQLKSKPYDLVLQLGAGPATLLLANSLSAATQKRLSGTAKDSAEYIEPSDSDLPKRIITFEHQKKVCTQLKKTLTAQGHSAAVEVKFAPLIEVNDQGELYYDLQDSLKRIPQILNAETAKLLVVITPPADGGPNPQAALSQLLQSLAAFSLDVVMPCNQADTELNDAWSAILNDRALEYRRHTDNSTSWALEVNAE
ncbi:hypothetical protein [Gilvimarinus xylanilyticus]|uniref:Uncharacterized protein n=1 Tax=Gilvimarinus xylanilyticus TaxID=2944139 RepID=A0A9X2I6G0_9GAMM|nr:hypothetical protein [Gilvimarinus xylanilyticus]MCP8900292.1 hypothetical protein [Gilvimarinus xylanilyticus]